MLRLAISPRAVLERRDWAHLGTIQLLVGTAGSGGTTPSRDVWRPTGARRDVCQAARPPARAVITPSGSFDLGCRCFPSTGGKCVRFNPLKGSGGRWLHFEVFSAIQV